MAQILVVAGAGIVLFLTVGVGIVAHELSHAVVLSLLGIQCDVAVGPERSGTSRFGATIPGTWASVTPREISPDTPARALRLSSIAPLTLAVPFAIVAVGPVPTPLGPDTPLFSALLIGWLACALPSPQDFSVFWHAERALAEHTADSTPE